jgi:hypothetical protein
LANVGKSGESKQTRLANVGESGESEQTRLPNVGESGESGRFLKKAILASTQIRQKWRISDHPPSPLCAHDFLVSNSQVRLLTKSLSQAVNSNKSP